VGDSVTVTVIVPCYNLGRYVEEAIDSVLAQTFTDFEVIVVNDGSTDDHTNDVLRSLRRPRTTVLTTANQGLPAARNHAIERAKGKYICALDADDKLHPRFLEKTVSVLENDPSVTFVSTWVECFGLESWTWSQERCDFPKLLAECVVLTASPVRREAVEAVGGYDTERYLFGSEDWDLWITLVERGHRGTIIPEVLFYYRQREGSMRRAAERGDTRRRVWQSLLDKHRDAYLRFLSEVLLLMESDCGQLLLDNWTLQYEITTQLEALVAERTADRDRLLAELDRAPSSSATQPALGELHHAYDQRTHELEAASAEVLALRSSGSWRITAPVRLAYDKWLAAQRLLTSWRGSKEHDPA